MSLAAPGTAGPLWVCWQREDDMGPWKPAVRARRNGGDGGCGDGATHGLIASAVVLVALDVGLCLWMWHRGLIGGGGGPLFPCLRGNRSVQPRIAPAVPRPEMGPEPAGDAAAGPQRTPRRRRSVSDPPPPRPPSPGTTVVPLTAAVVAGPGPRRGTSRQYPASKASTRMTARSVGMDDLGDEPLSLTGMSLADESGSLASEARGIA